MIDEAARDDPGGLDDDRRRSTGKRVLTRAGPPRRPRRTRAAGDDRPRDERLRAVPDGPVGTGGTGGAEPEGAEADEPGDAAPERARADEPGDAAPEALLARVARGDGDAFEQLYPVLAGAVYGLALRVLRNPGLAEDVSQEVFVDVWRLAPRFDRTRGSAMAWVLTIAHRRAVDRVRREVSQADRATRAAGLATDEVDIAAQLEQRWDAARVRHALASLTAVQREAIELAFFAGYTHQEVSGLLGIPLGTAKTRIRDGLIRLRDTLGVER